MDPVLASVRPSLSDDEAVEVGATAFGASASAAVDRGSEPDRKLRRALIEVTESRPCVGEVRGVGLALGVEFVTDRSSKEPTPGSWPTRSAPRWRRWAEMEHPATVSGW